MERFNIKIKLNEADTQKSVYLQHRRFYDEATKPTSRCSSLIIEGSVRNLTQKYDVILFDEGFTPQEEGCGKRAEYISIRIDLSDKDESYSYKPPFFHLTDSTIHIGGLSFSSDEFNYIRSIMDDKFTVLNLCFARLVSNDEIQKNKEKNINRVIDLDYNLDSVDYISKKIKKYDCEITLLHIKHNQFDLKIDSFKISSSIPKYVEKENWTPSIFSLKSKEDAASEIVLIENQDPHTTPLKTTDQRILFWLKVLVFLIFILIIKLT